jgi:gas vesicle protein
MNTYSDPFASNYSAGTWSAFVIGAAVGAAAALILAPATGRDTRAYLRRRGNELGHDAVERGRELGRDAMERGRDTLRTQSDRVKSAVASGWERAGSAISQAREEGEAAYREAKESFQADSGMGRSGYRTEPQRSPE